MSKRLVFLICWCWCQCALAQVKPNNFAEEPNPNNLNFEVYSQKGGVNRRASLFNVKRYMAPVMVGNVAYVPTATGNVNNRMDFVRDPNGQTWYIDAFGNAVAFESGSTWSWRTSGYTVGAFDFFISGTVPSDLTKVVVLRNGIQYKVGLPGCGDCGAVYNVSTNTFSVSRSWLSGETLQVKVSN